MVVPVWNYIWILRKSKFGNLVPTSKNYIESKKGESSEKVSKKNEVKIICTNLVFMDLINHFCLSGNVIGYINIHNPHLFTFGNTKLQYMSATAQVAAK